MKNQTMQKLVILVTLMLIIVPSSLIADPPRSWNHDSNPALLGIRNRRIFEIGMSPEFNLGNNYFNLAETLVQDLVIDLNDIYSNLGDRDLRIASTVSAEAHAVFSILGISIGAYSNVEGLVSAGIPNSIFDLVANGSTFEDEDLLGQSRVRGRVFADAGVYAGYRLRRDHYFGVKVGAFAPVFYTDNASELSFGFSTDSETSNTVVDLGANVIAYSALDFENLDSFDPNSASSLLNGVKLDIGYVRGDRRKPIYGFNISGITLQPATVGNSVTINVEEQIVLQNPLGNFGEEGEGSNELVVLPEFAVEPVYESGLDQRIFMPIQLGGFYRLRAIPLIDLIGHAQLYLEKPVYFGAGLIVEGSFFPFNIVSASFGYDRNMWNTGLGLKFNLWVTEIGLDVGFNSVNLGNLFNVSGAGLKVYFAIGM